jgi:hypothetical protein
MTPGNLLALVALLAAPPAEDVRTFAVLVDGKPAGEYHLAIRPAPDGGTVVESAGDFRSGRLITARHFTFHATETWRDGKLQRLEANSTLGGRKSAVVAEAADGALRVRVNGGPAVAARADAWVTTYWGLPAAHRRNGPLTVLDADTGKEVPAKLQPVGTETLTLAGRDVACNHYRLTSAVSADLWFDSAGRLVRQETVEDGHRTVLELRVKDR